LNTLEEELLDSLSVFRFGFNQQMASALWTALGYKGSSVRDLLERYVYQGRLRYFAGEYHRPGKPRKDWQYSSDPAADAKRHFAAALALTPYLSPIDTPGLALDRSLEPQYVHEANYHLFAARNLASDDQGLRQQIGNASMTLLRFAEYPGWYSVRGMLRLKNCTKDALEVALQLLETRKSSGTPPHPIHYLTTARLAEQRWKEQLNDRTLGKDVLDWLPNKIGELFQEAEQSCRERIFADETDYNRLMWLAARTLFHIKHPHVLKQARSTFAISPLIEEALDLLGTDVNGSQIPGEWYELVGDSFEDHKKADRIYEFGIKWVPQWRQLWIKYLGCACIVYPDARFVDCEVAEVRARALSSNDVHEILQLSYRTKDETNGQRRWVTDRWSSGVNLFRRLYKNEPTIQELIRSL
jgi:hypothetical protein